MRYFQIIEALSLAYLCITGSNFNGNYNGEILDPVDPIMNPGQLFFHQKWDSNEKVFPSFIIFSAYLR